MGKRKFKDEQEIKDFIFDKMLELEINYFPPLNDLGQSVVAYMKRNGSVKYFREKYGLLTRVEYRAAVERGREKFALHRLEMKSDTKTVMG